MWGPAIIGIVTAVAVTAAILLNQAAMRPITRETCETAVSIRISGPGIDGQINVPGPAELCWKRLRWSSSSQAWEL